MKIGILTCINLPDLLPSEEFLIPALTNKNHAVTAVIWDDVSIKWTDFDLLIFRNTWDYYEKQAAFDIWLNKIEIAKQRVEKRVAEGGHNIPLDIIERRYKKGLMNLEKYCSIADLWFIYDNSFGEYELIAKQINETRKIFNLEAWQKIFP